MRCMEEAVGLFLTRLASVTMAPQPQHSHMPFKIYGLEGDITFPGGKVLKLTGIISDGLSHGDLNHI